MRRLIILILAVLFVAGPATAQRKYKRNKVKIHSITFGGGATNFLGELGGANRIGSRKISIRDFDFPSIRPNITLGYQYRFHKHWATKAEINAAFIGGHDRLTEEEFRNNRNLNFRAPIIELSGRMEYLIPFTRKGQQYDLNVRGWRNINVHTFLFAGVAGFWFDPYGKYNDRWYRLKPLCTEGQTVVSTRPKSYSNFQLSIPMGIGFRYAINKTWTLSIEYGTRWTFTDYIDDVSLTYVDYDALRAAKGDLAVMMSNPSPTANDPTNPYYNSTRAGQQRGDPRDKDSYMFISLSVHYKLGRGFTPKLRF